MLCRSSGAESLGAGADTGAAAILGAAVHADSVSSAALDVGPGAALGTGYNTRTQSVAPLPEQKSCAQQMLPFSDATPVPPADPLHPPGLLPSSSISAGSIEAASLPIHEVRQSTSQAASLLPDRRIQYFGPLPGPPSRSSIPARHTEAATLEPAGAVGAQLGMHGPSLTDHGAGSSTPADR